MDINSQETRSLSQRARPAPHIAPSNTLGSLISHIILSNIIFQVESNIFWFKSLFINTL